MHNVQVRAAGDAGQGLFASKAIEAGSLILSLDRPLLTALDNKHLADMCSNCLLTVEETNSAVQACQGCHNHRYCSKVRTYEKCVAAFHSPLCFGG